jgi:hypothetical protein
MSEAIRIVVSNGMILYALTRKKARSWKRHLLKKLNTFL